ncbi:MAG: hypothetical protein IKR38_09335 [Bacteroidales bacterium]|nr:hypothetical protein [Bacteroidales bacterium]
MKLPVVVLLLMTTLSAWGWEREYIWPKGKMPNAQPGQIAAMTDVSEAPGFKPEKHRIPYLGL